MIMGSKFPITVPIFGSIVYLYSFFYIKKNFKILQNDISVYYLIFSPVITFICLPIFLLMRLTELLGFKKINRGLEIGLLIY